MKKLTNLRIGALMFMLMALSVTSAYADVDDFEISVRDVTQTASNILEFDVYLLDTDAGQAFEFGGTQIGLLLNSLIYGSGSLTVTIDNSGSGLDSDQQYIGAPNVVTSLSGYPYQTLIRLAANSEPPYPPGAGTGSVISTTGYGTLLTHFVVTSTEDFTINSTADLVFCASAAVSPLFPTIVYAYIDGNSTALTVTPGTNAIVDGNPLLNETLPTIFDVTGGGSYCEGDAGLPVGLSGSETGVTYTLYRDLAEVATLAGTGSALSFGDQTEGTYTVTGTNAAGSVSMNGQAVVVAYTNTVTPASSTPTLCINTALTPITHTTTGATGIGAATGLPGGVTANWAANTITISGTPAAAGTFNYSIPLAGGCGTVSATGTITVDAQPTTSPITGSATPACNGTGYTYSVTNTPQSGYIWTVPDDATITDGQGTHSITVDFGTTNGNITVTETNGVGCVGTPVTLAISLQGCGLDANFTGTPLEICVGSTVTFTNTSTGTTGSTTYSWNFGAGASPATANTIGPHTVTYTSAGSKTVSLTITEGASSTETRSDYITVNPTNTITLTSGTGTDDQTVCINIPITSITYGTTGATGAEVTGLPSGVTGTWSSDLVTISGTPDESGTFDYTVTLTGGCGTITANGTLTVNICSKTLNLSSVLLEGLYNGSGTMRQAQNALGAQWPAGVADHITVELHDGANYANIVWSDTDVPLNTYGAAMVIVPVEYSGAYYITIKHRNSLETTTSSAVSFANATISRSFATRASVYGNNLGTSGDGYYVIYGADVNQDGIVDTGDMNDVDNGSTTILIGYNVPDANGDGIVDTSDMNIVDNNSTAIVMIRLPY